MTLGRVYCWPTVTAFTISRPAARLANAMKQKSLKAPGLLLPASLLLCDVRLLNLIAGLPRPPAPCCGARWHRLGARGL